MSNASFKDIKISGFPEGLYIRGKSYRYRRNYNGKRILQIWGDIPYDEAELRADQLNLDLKAGKPIAEIADKTTFAAFVTDVWLKKKSSEIRTASLARYRAVAENFIMYLKEKKLERAGIETITYQLASDYIFHRSQANLMPNGHKKFTKHKRVGASKSTLHFERNALYSMFKEAAKRNLIRQNPFQDVKSKKPSRQEVATAHHPLTEAEEAALLQAAKSFDGQTKEKGNPSFFDLFFFLVKTGLRENELRNLEWTDIDWHNGVIRIGTKKVFETRTISIPNFAVDGLRRRVRGKQPQDSVFLDSKDVLSFGFRLAIRTMPELLALTVQDVDIPNRVIKMTREYTWLPKATNGKVPMCEGVRTLLRRLEENHTSNFVFAHHDGGACRVDIWDALKTVQKMAGILGRLRVHDLRHTLAIRLREKGVSLETIMGILRHANIEETLIYAPYQIEEGKNAMRLLDSSPKTV